MNLLKRTTAFFVVTLVLGTAGCTDSSSNAAITSRVRTAISNEPGLKETKVSVSTDEKVVHLGGTVKSRSERAMLIAVARKVEGVKAVKTDLVVTPQQNPGAKPQQKPAVKPGQEENPGLSSASRRAKQSSKVPGDERLHHLMRLVRHRPWLIHPQVLAALEDLEPALAAGGAVGRSKLLL
jgi:BON domain